MKTPVQLYLGDSEIEFNSPPSIFYNYSQTDVLNPTTVRNSWSKSITIEGTKVNNSIFGSFWRMDRLVEPGNDGTTGAFFNPATKVPFKLYVNGDLYEEGYAKLDNVAKTGEKVEYTLSLYGQLGSFFANLKYNAENGNNLKLSDLVYTEEGGDDELDFNITRTTVSDAWQRINGVPGYDELYDIINFVPSYNGIPESLDADKVLIDMNGLDLTTAVTESGKTYDTYNGYALMKLDNKLTEWEARDLRSYLQRPAIRVRKVIEACCDPRNNGGYNVTLDDDFFNDANPDFNDTWVTLPLLTDIKYEPENTSYGQVSIGDAEGNDYIFWYDVTITDTPIPLNTVSLDLTFSLTPTSDEARKSLFNSHIHYDNNKVYRFLSSYFVQLVGFDSGGSVVCASNAKNLTNIVEYNGSQYYGNESIYKSDSEYGSNAFESYLNMPVDLIDGFWRYDANNDKLSWSTGNVTFSLEGAENVKTIRLMVKRSALVDKPFADFSRSEYRKRLFTSEVSKNWWLSSGVTLNDYSIDKPVLTSDRLITYAEGGIHSNSLITKKMLLDTEFTPCDFLLSYTKIFGLYFLKSNTGKNISILTRSNFFRNQLIDIEDLVDRSEITNITPLALENKWYDFKLDTTPSQFASQYSKTTDTTYGMKRVDTCYDFNPEAKNLYEGNVFKTAIQCIEKSPYYMVPTNGGKYPSYFNTDIKYNLFNGQEEYEVTVRKASEYVPVNSARYYDCISKMQFHSDENKPEDGSFVMLYYNGHYANRSTDGHRYGMMLSDDVPEMTALNNGSPCWFYTSSRYNPNAELITALPQFGRYRTNLAGYVESSLDFGQPRQTYLKDVIINSQTEDSTVYSRYWKRYIEDLYSVNTRTVTLRLLFRPVLQGGAFVIGDKPNPEWLRNFYWFDNAVWVLNSINDWDVSSFDTTEVELIKVQDISDYTTAPAPVIPTYIYPVLDLRSTTTLISQTGGTASITVDSNMSWSASTDAGTLSASAGTGNTVTTAGTDYDHITLEVPKWYDPTTPDTQRTITVSASGAVDGIYDTLEFVQQKWKPEVKVRERATIIDYRGGTFNNDWNLWNTADVPFTLDQWRGWPSSADTGMTVGMVASSYTNDYTVRQYIGIGTNSSKHLLGAFWQGGLADTDTGATSPWYAYDTWYVMQFPDEFVFDAQGNDPSNGNSIKITLPVFMMDDLEVTARPSWLHTSKVANGIVMYCQVNDGYERTGSMVVYSPTYGQIAVDIRQLGSVFENPARRAQQVRVGIGYAYPSDDGLSFTNNYSAQLMPVEDTGSGNTYWSATTDSSWIRLSNASATGSGAILVTVTENPQASARTGMVTIHSASADTSFMVHQSDWSGGTGGSGMSENDVVELTQAEYDQLTSYTENTIYVITDATCFNPDDYYTSAQTNSAITSATSAFTTSGDFKTINSESLVGSGNIIIPTAQTQVSVTAITTAGTNIAAIDVNGFTTNLYTPEALEHNDVVELTKAQYSALTAYSEDTLYVITDAACIDMSKYYTSAQTNSAITAKTGDLMNYWKNVEDQQLTFTNIVDMLNYNMTCVFANFQRKPVVLYQTDGTTGLLGINATRMDETTWQLENLDFSPYKYVKCYIKEADLPLSGTDNLYATPSVVVFIPLDDASKSTQYNSYVGGGGATNMNDTDVHFQVLCAIDGTKSKFKVVSEHSIAGTIKGDRNTNGRYCYKIEGCFD